jgi:hypothetical protein
MMTARPPAPAATGFDQAFELAQSSIFRLETLQSYGNSGEDPALDAFRAGQPHLVTPGKREWTALVRDRVHGGCAMQRVHVVTEPASEYLRFELTWGYGPNAEAGEEIRIIPLRQDEAWPRDVPCHDFWLFDSCDLYDIHYEPDGTWLGVEQVRDSAAIADARRWRDAALRLARPWADYIQSRPDLARHVPQETVHRAS